MVGGDCLWCVNVFAYAKRFLRLPVPLYFYRCYNDNSITRTVRTPAEQTNYWISAAVNFLKGLNELQNKVEFLREHPVYCLKIAEKHFDWYIYRVSKALSKFGNRDIYKILSYQFGAKDTMFEAAAPFFFTLIADKNKNLLDEQLISRIRPYITARIDIKLITNVGDLQISFVSDDKAKINKPAFLNKDGIGYVINSYVGRLEFVAKATVDGQIQLYLRGNDVRDPDNNSKRIPYWIDYTKLTVNKQTILNTLTPTWHNKPYKYNMEVQAGEEITFQIEWLPHRSDT